MAPTDSKAAAATDPKQAPEGLPKESNAEKQAKNDQKEHADVASGTAPLDGLVIRAEKPERAMPRLGTVDVTAPVVVEQDVYEEFYPAGAKRPSYRLLFTRGQVVAGDAYARATERAGA